jgi:hypothetical protein
MSDQSSEFLMSSGFPSTILKKIQVDVIELEQYGPDNYSALSRLKILLR